MNLYDLVRRKDAALEIGGQVEACDLKRPSGRVRALRFAPGSTLRVRTAHEAHCLREFPADVGWRASSEADWKVTVEMASPSGETALAQAQGAAASESAIALRWPVPVPPRFDIVVRCTAAQPVLLVVGPLVDTRAVVRPLIRGRGVEIGPGLNPQVKPAPGVEVRYVEKKHPKEWAATYAKRELVAEEMALWQHYVVDSARHLTQFADGSLDFIFSNHVFEHLVDPVGTLLRWWQRLAPGGVVAGVVPDMRYTFDWRQPPWEMADVRAQRDMQGDEPTEAMYQRWCRYTAPHSSPEALRARDYSIHVNYYTPALMRQVLDEAAREIALAGGAAADGVFVQAHANGKDFPFALRKAR